MPARITSESQRERREQIQSLMRAGASLNTIRRETGADYRTVRTLDPNYKPFDVGGSGDAAVIRETNRQLTEFLRRGKIGRNRDAGFERRGDK